MKTLLIGLLIVLLLVAIDWISFSRAPDKANIHVETEKIQRDTEEMVESGNELINRTGEEIESTNDSITEDSEDYEEPIPSPESTNDERPFATEDNQSLEQQTAPTAEANP